MFRITFHYILKNKIISIVALYFLVSTILKATTGIDICIPCLWTLIFGFHCPGCGLTTAFISILKLNFIEAFESNWLIFIILPAGLYFLINDFVKYKKEYSSQPDSEENSFV